MATALGKYEIRSTIAAGPSATVYEGWDSSINRRVAIKKMALSEASHHEGWQHLVRFRREAQAAARLQHPNLVAIFDYGETPEYAYIVMEFVEGSTLEAMLNRGERFPVSAISRLMGDILAGLQYCHERGVVHRDIKPSNVMVTRDGQAKIADFGLARLDDSNLTQIGTVMGTPAYMSPEQFRGETTDARSDIYSAGVILYHLLTGERPFDGGLATIMHKALNTVPPKPSELSGAVGPQVDGLVARAMAKRPDQRFQTAQEFADALRAGLAVRAARRQPVLGALPGFRPQASVSAKSSVYIAAAVGALVIAAGGAAAVIGYRPWTTRGPAAPVAAIAAHESSHGSKPGVEQAKKEEAKPSPASTASSPVPPADNAYRQLEANLPAEQADVAGPAPNLLPPEASTPAPALPIAPAAGSLPPAVAASLIPTPALASIPKEPPNLPRGDARGPGPRVAKKAPIPPAVDALPPPRRPKSEAMDRHQGQEDAALLPASPGGKAQDAGNSPPVADQEAKQPPTPKAFGRYEVRNGQRVFIAAP